MVERLHYSRTSELKLVQRGVHPSPSHKPGGTWYSIGSAWYDWCVSERFPIGRYAWRLVLKMDKVLQLATPHDMAEFTRDFMFHEKDSDKAYRIRWADVVDAGWHAIEINPYQWDCRSDRLMSWYYGWDVASGCIWHPDEVVLHYEFIGEIPAAWLPNEYDWSM